jgi:hypothetical protein
MSHLRQRSFLVSLFVNFPPPLSISPFRLFISSFSLLFSSHSLSPLLSLSFLSPLSTTPVCLFAFCVLCVDNDDMHHENEKKIGKNKKIRMGGPAHALTSGSMIISRTISRIPTKVVALLFPERLPKGTGKLHTREKHQRRMTHGAQRQPTSTAKRNDPEKKHCCTATAANRCDMYAS